jgi:hypothetical protein
MRIGINYALPPTHTGATFFMVSQISAQSQELPCCPGSFAGSSRFLLLNSTYSYSCAPTERDRVAWLWALFFAFAAPEVASFLMALRAILMRSTSSPTIIELAVCLAFELVHTVGVAILFFIAFPGEPFMYVRYNKEISENQW